MSIALVKNCDMYVVSASDENEVLIRVQVEQHKDGELSQITNYLDGKAYQKMHLKVRR